MKVETIILNGKPRVGKDTFITLSQNHLIQLGYSTEEYSLIDPIRNFAEHIDKSDNYRKALHLMKKALDECEEYSLQNLLVKKITAAADRVKYVTSKKKLFIFINIREEKDIKEIKEKLLAKGITVKTVVVTANERVQNREYGNAADDTPLTISKYDLHITNDSTVDDLKMRISNNLSFFIGNSL